MQEPVELWRPLVYSAIDPTARAEENGGGGSVEVELSQLEG